MVEISSDRRRRRIESSGGIPRYRLSRTPCGHAVVSTLPRSRRYGNRYGTLHGRAMRVNGRACDAEVGLADGASARVRAGHPRSGLFFFFFFSRRARRVIFFYFFCFFSLFSLFFFYDEDPGPVRRRCCYVLKAAAAFSGVTSPRSYTGAQDAETQSHRSVFESACDFARLRSRKRMRAPNAFGLV